MNDENRNRELVVVNNDKTQSDADMAVFNEISSLLNSFLGPIGGGQFFLPQMGGLSDLFNMLGHMPRKKAKPPKDVYDDIIKFSYYGNTGQCNHHKGVICLAVVVNEKGGVIHYGIAYCSPKDVYDKAKGKKIAYVDLAENMNTCALSKKSHHGVNASIFADLYASADSPSWARLMVQRNLIRHLNLIS